MKFTVVHGRRGLFAAVASTAFMLCAATAAVAEKKQQGIRREQRQQHRQDEGTKEGKPQRALGMDRTLNGGKNTGVCESCPFDLYYHYRSVKPGDSLYQPFVKNQPPGCRLAAIRDDNSRRGAQYAIPPGQIAITQGYFPIDSYLQDCHFVDHTDAKALQGGNVTACENDYASYFVNFDGTSVPMNYDDSSSSPHTGGVWDIPAYPFAAGALHAGLGADGILRPLQKVFAGLTQELEGDEERARFAFDGAVYECCPDIEFDICNVIFVDDLA